MTTVWVDDWQFECCGDRFRITDTVAWTVRPPDTERFDHLFGPGTVAVDAAQENHATDDEPLRTVTGTVTGIDAVHCGYERGRDHSGYYPVAGSATRTPLSAVAGGSGPAGDRQLVGYLVELDLSPAAGRSPA